MDTGELFPVISSSTSGVGEREEFPEDFGKYMHRELNWARLEDDDGEPHVTGWVFWSRKDDNPNRPSVSDRVSEDLNLIPDSGLKVKDKIRLALGRIILHPRCGRSLVQYWAAATTIEGRTLLTTQNQPYALGKTGRSTWGLCEYRIKSMEYKFYGDIGESGEEELGLPGRVFLHKLPESAPDVQYYSLKEYPQRDDASCCQVRASWALPVFEHSSQICVGVLELVSTIDAIKDWYDKSFLRNLHDVFQELGLQSIDCCKHHQMKYKDEDQDVTSAFDELVLVLELLCKVHNLPLALAWVPCSVCDALLLGQLSSKGAEYLGAFEANDNHLLDFLVASTGCHLRNGQVVERVLSSPNMLYCSDITQFSIAEYPLVPFARQCKLSGWFTICLHSSYTGDNVYILEFFLPVSSKDNENTLTTVRTILGTMKANSKTFKLASGKELGEVLSIEVFYFQNGEKLQYVQTIQASLELLKSGGMTLQLGHLDQPLLDAINDGRDDIRTKEGGPVATSSKGGTTKIQERKQKKSGVRFDISLDDVLRFSALSRTNAARELKVSVSTLKRVCRKYGIHRWPPRDTSKEAYAIALPNVEDIVHLDSPEEPSLMEFDDAINGAYDLREDDSGPFITHLEKESLPTFKDLQQHFDRKSGDAAKSHGVSAERNNLDVTCSKEATIRGQGKAGVRIEIPLEDIFQYSNKRLDFAASELKVSVSTLKRICRNYGIERWPPRNIERVCHFQPSPVENQGQTPRTSNLTSLSVAHKTQAFQDEDMVTIKVKYENNTFKFHLFLSSRLVELQQEVAKRLNLDAGTYYVKYKDEEDDLIVIACDEDLQSCLHISRSLGNTSTVVLLELKDA